MNGKPGPNQFHDINKLPKEWGIIVFPISMSRIGNAQSPTACLETLAFFTNKVSANRGGVHFLYTEGLYMNLEKDAWETKNRFSQSAVNHMRGIKRLVAKNYKKYQIDSAFSFTSWFQMYLSHPSFFQIYKATENLYKTDKKFREAIAQDAKEQKRRLDPQQLSFYLEEHTLSYLLLNRQIEIANDFVHGREEWVLLTYPGRPPRGQIYLYQKDPLHLNKDVNPYKGQYDTQSRRFIDYRNVDLESY